MQFLVNWGFELAYVYREWYFDELHSGLTSLHQPNYSYPAKTTPRPPILRPASDYYAPPTYTTPRLRLLRPTCHHSAPHERTTPRPVCLPTGPRPLRPPLEGGIAPSLSVCVAAAREGSLLVASEVISGSAHSWRELDLKSKFSNNLWQEISYCRYWHRI